MKAFSIFEMGFEIFSNCAKLSSVLGPRIKNDLSLILLNITTNYGEHHVGASKTIKIIINLKVSLRSSHF